jgi:hypothetical protein
VRHAPTFHWRAVVAGFLLLAGSAAPAYAQAPSNDPALHRFEAAFAVGWFGGAGLGTRDANLRTRAGDDFRLFSTDSRFDATAGIEVRGAYALTSRYMVEGRVGISHPDLSTSITGDVESAPDLTVSERIDQYTFEGALVRLFPGIRVAAMVPFASGGAGYLRQLHEGQTLVDEGVAYHLGGGLRRSLLGRDSGWVKGAGVRVDARLYIHAGGIEFDDGARIHPAVSGSVFLAF